MGALPADIAKYTQDGVLVRSSDAEATTIKASFASAKDEEETPRETFFRNEADAIAVEALRFAFVKRINPKQDEIEVDADLGIGNAFSIAPIAPKATVLDAPSENAYIGIVRSFVHSTATGRMALSVIEG